MDGYKKFHGDHAGMQLRYYEFANWFFCSPFMACMREQVCAIHADVTLPPDREQRSGAAEQQLYIKNMLVRFTL